MFKFPKFKNLSKFITQNETPHGGTESPDRWNVIGWFFEQVNSSSIRNRYEDRGLSLDQSISSSIKFPNIAWIR
jgi:hypothetical protein